jgi:hypothetical protein
MPATVIRYIYQISIEFLFNEPTEIVATNDLVFMARGAVEWVNYFTSLSQRIESSKHNYYVAKAVGSIANAKYSDGVKQRLKSMESFSVEVVSVALDESKDRNDRLGALDFLSKIGVAAVGALPELTGKRTNDTEVNAKIEETIVAIREATETLPDLKIHRTDGHLACDPVR